MSLSSYELLKNQLESELKKITSELETIATQSPGSGDWVATPVAEDLKNADKNVEADAVEEWENRQALLVQLETRYRNVVRALEKMKTGTYGICEISGAEIELERLQANPTARTNLANIDREKELYL